MPKSKPAVRLSISLPAALYAAMEKERWAERLNRSGFIHQALCERLGLNYGTLKPDLVLRNGRRKIHVILQGHSGKGVSKWAGR